MRRRARRAPIALILAATIPLGAAAARGAAAQTTTPRAAAAPSAVASPAADRLADAVDAGTLRAHFDFLAHDLLEGRAPATRGGALTEAYLAAQFRRLGLEAVLQPVPLVHVTPRSASLARPRDGATLCAGLEACLLLPTGADSLVTLAAPAVFAGFGIVAPEEGHDDYAGLDVRGRVVVVLGGTPAAVDAARFRREAPESYGGRDHKLAQAARHGALALLIVHDDRLLPRLPWPRVRALYAAPGHELARGGPVRAAGYVDHAVGARLLAPLGALDSLVRAAARPAFRGAPLPDTLRLAVRAAVRADTAHNVVGRLAGHGALAAEAVVVGAHHDGLGIGLPIAGDSIYNGAEDNAGGVAAMLALAEAFVRSGVRPARTVYFVGFTAEEAGLFGSEWFVARPPVPIARIAAMLNMDGLNLYAPSREAWALGLELSTLGERFRDAARAEGRTASIAEAERRLLESERFFFRSDHYNFARAGVPSLFLWSGFTAVDRPAGWLRAQLERYLAERYHRPGDEPHPWHDARAAALDLRVLARTVLAAANDPARPRWHPHAPFAARR